MVDCVEIYLQTFWKGANWRHPANWWGQFTETVQTWPNNCCWNCYFRAFHAIDRIEEIEIIYIRFRISTTDSIGTHSDWGECTDSTFKIYISNFQLVIIFKIIFQFLIEKIEPLCQKYACSDVFIAEYRDRLLCSDAIRLYRYLPEEIYCSSCSDYYEGIDIQRYDFTENKWNQFKSELFDSQNCDFGSIFLNGELIIMGGQEEDEGGDRLKDVSAAVLTLLKIIETIFYSSLPFSGTFI